MSRRHHECLPARDGGQPKRSDRLCSLAPGRVFPQFVVRELAEVEEHLCLTNEREQGQFLRDAGKRAVAGLSELPADHGDGIAQSRAKRPS